LLRSLPVFILLAIPLWGQDPVIRPVDAEQGIEVAALVQDLQGNVIWEYQSDKAMVLASNTKLFTTAAALLRLGPSYRWRTKVFLSENQLTIVGGGDPSLRETPAGNYGEKLLDGIAAKLKQRGVTSVPELLLDNSFFQGAQRHALWPEEQWQNVWCAPISALAVEGNCLSVSVKGRKLVFQPALKPALKINSRDTGRGKGLSAWWEGDFSLAVRGDLRRNGEIRLAVKDSREVFALWAQEGLRKRGVLLPKFRWAADESVRHPGELVLEFHSGWTLAEALAVANKDSDNYVTEVLMRTLAAESGFPADFSGGAQAVRAALQQSGWTPKTLNLADGSGLARGGAGQGNEASPRDLCSLLAHMALQEEGATFFDSLPISGAEGSSKGWFQEPIFQPSRVHAKTGWIHGASSLSGYLLAGEDDVLVFSFLVNYVRDGKPRTHNNRFKKMREAALREVLKKWNPR